MILSPGEKIHVVERRYFPGDISRHFCGEVVECSEQNLVRLKGYLWVWDAMKKEFIKKAEMREKILFLGDRLTVNVVPREVNLSSIKYVIDIKRGLLVTDGKGWSLDINEYSSIN